MRRGIPSPGPGFLLNVTFLLALGLASIASGQAADNGASGRGGSGGAPAAANASLEALQVDADEDAPVIDGLVNEEIWTRVPAASGFIQQDPREGEPATERTEVRILFDRRTLYLSFICFDSRPDQIVVTESRRDAGLNETDSIQVLIDTFNDGQNAFVFGTNPLGIEYDGQVAGEGQTTARPPSSRPTSAWRCSTAAGRGCSWSTTSGGTPRGSIRKSCWAGRLS